MAALHFTLLCVLVTFVVLPTARASGVRQALYLHNAGIDGQKPNATALFQTPAHSPIHCGIQCSRLDGCRSYTYIADQPSSCRGYDVAMTSQTMMTPAAGAKTFEVVLAGSGSGSGSGSGPDWLESPCSSNDECPVAQAECFKGNCTCSPGYYYSNRGKTCLAVCPLADLTEGFVKYKGSSGYGTVLWSGVVTDVFACQERCLHNVTGCRSIIYLGSSLGCNLSNDTALTAVIYFRDDPPYDLYQRTCN